VAATSFKEQQMREFMTGAEAIVRGAIDAGCDFFAGYPITPATPILLHMMRELPKAGGKAVQGEDEIASIGFCIGATMAGARAMTATSGPGISLYSENIGAAIMGEVPLVIVNCQRLGPATGGATATAQGDIQFMRWGTSGGYPLIVLAPSGVQDCYSLTMRAFDLAERFRLPVLLATDKETVLAYATVEIGDSDRVPVRERKLAPADSEFIPYRTSELNAVPPMSHFGGPHTVRFTTSSHDERGYLSKDQAAVDRLNQRLDAKVSNHLDEIALFDWDPQKGADALVISYGITSRAAIEAVESARSAGSSVSALTLYSLWPVPEEPILKALHGIKRIVIPELNQGQYLREIERLAEDGQQLTGVHRVDGGLITPEQIIEQGGLQ
jgi:2-oxoglutarate ferredoxin oxidoreductase subunit alpha